ncbi:MAG: Oligopeptide transport ATP-binding protein OppD [bacterium]|nr:Oligopeptide transport ATP-binding protein OppD [bacterium]
MTSAAPSAAPGAATATSSAASSRTPLLEVRNLKVYFPIDEGVVKAVDDVSFTIHEGETLGIVGESGSGKSVTALTVMRILASNGRIMGGQILFRGRDLLTLPEKEMQRIRGNEIAMIFQDPMTCLNPVLSVGDQLSEAIILHQKVKKKEAWERATEMLRRVRIPLPEERMKQFPFELSGGMRQRVMIAMALSCNPSLLIADEPTTALDVTIQAQILELIAELQQEFNMAVQMITHDLGVVAEICDRVVVMYAGRVAETGMTQEIFRQPKHPYTEGLLACLPRLDEKRSRLHPIEGQPPNLAKLPPGCPFVLRCPKRFPECIDVKPPLYQVSESQASACLLLDEEYRLKALRWYDQQGQQTVGSEAQA